MSSTSSVTYTQKTSGIGPFKEEKMIDQQLQPPVAKRVYSTYGLHKDQIEDPYGWMEGDNKPDLISYCKEENAYTKAVLQKTKVLRQTLYQEMAARARETVVVGNINLLASKVGSYYYFWDGDQYVRCKYSPENPEKTVLDLSTLEKTCGKYEDFGYCSPSPNGKYLAFTIDRKGSEVYTIYVKNLETGEILTSQKIENTNGDIAWCYGGGRFLYVVDHPETLRPYKVMARNLSSPEEADICVYEEKDDKFLVDVELSRTGRCVIITSSNYNTTEVRVATESDPIGSMHVMEPRKEGVRYYVTHHVNKEKKESFYILLSEGKKNFKLMHCPLKTLSRDSWSWISAYDESIDINSITPFAEFLVVQYREKGLPKIDVLVGGLIRQPITGFPEESYSGSIRMESDYYSQKILIDYSSLITPPKTYVYDAKEQNLGVVTETKMGDYNPEDYAMTKVFAQAEDDTQIPIYLAHHKNAAPKPGSQTPIYLYGYGAYGVCDDTWFRDEVPCLLDRGVTYGLAQIRGGGEFGQKWYFQGKQLNKTTTFTDYLSCAKFLVHKQYTVPEKFVASGKSAGGLLMGAVTVSELAFLFKCIHNRKGFTDVLKSMIETNLPLSTTEISEWGDVQKKEDYEYIKAYSPQNIIVEKEYPALLAVAAKDDEEVLDWIVMKWVAALRYAHKGDNPIIAKTEMSGGHYDDDGGDVEYPRYLEWAIELGFVLDVIDQKEKVNFANDKSCVIF